MEATFLCGIIPRVPGRGITVSLVCVLGACSAMLCGQGAGPSDLSPSIPTTWDDAEISALEVPLASGAGSPKHVSASYYYRIAVRRIYKSMMSTPPVASQQVTPPGSRPNRL